MFKHGGKHVLGLDLLILCFFGEPDRFLYSLLASDRKSIESHICILPQRRKDAERFEKTFSATLRLRGLFPKLGTNRLGSLDRFDISVTANDLDLSGLRLFTLGKSNRQDAIVELGLYAIDGHAIRQRERAGE